MLESSIYIASNLGFNESGRYYLKNILLKTLSETNFSLLDPWSLTDIALINKTNTLPSGVQKIIALQKINQLIAKNNQKAIDKCALILAILDGTDVDSGTSAEIGYAFAKKKKIIGLRTDLRLSGDNHGAQINLQVEYFITSSGGKIFSSLEEVLQYLKTWKKS